MATNITIQTSDWAEAHATFLQKTSHCFARSWSIHDAAPLVQRVISAVIPSLEYLFSSDPREDLLLEEVAVIATWYAGCPDEIKEHAVPDLFTFWVEAVKQAEAWREREQWTTESFFHSQRLRLHRQPTRENLTDMGRELKQAAKSIRYPSDAQLALKCAELFREKIRQTDSSKPLTRNQSRAINRRWRHVHQSLEKRRWKTDQTRRFYLQFEKAKFLLQAYRDPNFRRVPLTEHITSLQQALAENFHYDGYDSLGLLKKAYAMASLPKRTKGQASRLRKLMGRWRRVRDKMTQFWADKINEVADQHSSLLMDSIRPTAWNLGRANNGSEDERYRTYVEQAIQFLMLPAPSFQATFNKCFYIVRQGYATGEVEGALPPNQHAALLFPQRIVWNESGGTRVLRWSDSISHFIHSQAPARQYQQLSKIDHFINTVIAPEGINQTLYRRLLLDWCQYCIRSSSNPLIHELRNLWEKVAIRFNINIDSSVTLAEGLTCWAIHGFSRNRTGIDLPPPQEMLRLLETEFDRLYGELATRSAPQLLSLTILLQDGIPSRSFPHLSPFLSRAWDHLTSKTEDLISISYNEFWEIDRQCELVLLFEAVIGPSVTIPDCSHIESLPPLLHALKESGRFSWAQEVPPDVSKGLLNSLLAISLIMYHCNESDTDWIKDLITSKCHNLESFIRYVDVVIPFLDCIERVRSLRRVVRHLIFEQQGFFYPTRLPDKELAVSLQTYLPLITRKQQRHVFMLLVRTYHKEISVEFAFELSKLVASSKQEPSSAQAFERLDETDQVNWLHYFALMRKLGSLPILEHVIQGSSAQTQILAALNALRQIGVATPGMEERLLSLQNRSEHDFRVGIQAAAALWFTHRNHASDSHLAAVSALFLEAQSEEHLIPIMEILSHYQITQENSAQVIHRLLNLLKTASPAIQRAATVVLTHIPSANILQLARTYVLSDLFSQRTDRMGRSKYVGHHHQLLGRPAEQDSRAALLDRIDYQLSRLVEPYPITRAMIDSEIQEIKAIPDHARLVQTPVAFGGCYLARTIWARHSEPLFWRSFFDFVMKGCGKADLTFFDSPWTANWARLGYTFFAADLFTFPVRWYEESPDMALLILIKGDVYDEERIQGRTRLEKEDSLNPVFYEGLALSQIDRVYCPESLWRDLERLYHNDEAPNAPKLFENEPFRDLTMEQRQIMQWSLRRTIGDSFLFDLFHQVPNGTPISDVLKADNIHGPTTEGIATATIQREANRAKAELLYGLPLPTPPATLFTLPPEEVANGIELSRPLLPDIVRNAFDAKNNHGRTEDGRRVSVGEHTMELFLPRHGGLGLRTDVKVNGMTQEHVRLALNWPALLHDIGKVDGCDPQHVDRSVRMTREMLTASPAEFGVDTPLIDLICALIRHNDSFGLYLQDKTSLEDLRASLKEGARQATGVTLNEFGRLCFVLFAADASTLTVVQGRKPAYLHILANINKLSMRNLSWVDTLY